MTSEAAVAEAARAEAAREEACAELDSRLSALGRDKACSSPAPAPASPRGVSARALRARRGRVTGGMGRGAQTARELAERDLADARAALEEEAARAATLEAERDAAQQEARNLVEAKAELNAQLVSAKVPPGRLSAPARRTRGAHCALDGWRGPGGKCGACTGGRGA